MVFVADTLAAWLIGLVADAGRKKLTVMLGSEQERALRSAATAAVERTAAELRPGDGKRAEQLALVISEVFGDPAPGAPLEGHATVLEALQAGIAGRIAVLDDASLTGSGQSSADVLAVPATVVAAKLTGHLLQEIVVRGSSGGPLFPLAAQLNDDVTHLHGQRIEDMLGQLADEVREALARLGGTRAVTAAPTALAQLPSATTGFTGRDEDLAVLAGLLDPAGSAGPVVVSAVAGLAGVGKTALAVQAGWAATERGWFPGGALFIDLHGYDQVPVEPGQALDALLRALGVPVEHIPPMDEERAGLYRSVLAQIGEPVLVIADNASAEAQVRPLLPGVRRHKVLVTSRHTLADLDARLVDVTVLDEQAGVELLDRALRDARPEDGRITGHPKAAGQLAGLCGGLPLALRITAALLKAAPTLSVAELAGELAIESQRLEALKYDPAGLSVAAAFELSYRRLEQIPARVFRLLPVNPGPDISTAAAAVLAEMPDTEARKVLEGLAQAHMIEVAPGATGRWRMHDLLRLYARRRSDDHAEADGREQALDLLLAYYLGGTVNANDRFSSLPGKAVTGLFASREAALDWLDEERHNLVAATTVHGGQVRDRIALMMSITLAGYLAWRRRWDDLLATSTISLELARRSGDRTREGIALINLGQALQQARRLDEAAGALHHAATIYRETGDRGRLALTLSNLGIVQREASQLKEAISSLREALAAYKALDDQRGEAMALNNLGRAMAQDDQTDVAILVFYDAVAICREIGDRHSEGAVLNNLGGALGKAGRLGKAIAALHEAASIFRDTGDRHSQGAAMNDLGSVLIEAGELGDAIRTLREAVAIFRETGDQRAEGIALHNLGWARTAQQA